MNKLMDEEEISLSFVFDMMETDEEEEDDNQWVEFFIYCY